MNIQDAIANAKAAGTAYDQEFVAKYAETGLDFGTCGMAVILIGFGRKRKLKQEAKDAGLIDFDTWKRYGQTYMVSEIERGPVPTQAIEYYENRANRVADELQKYYEGTGVEVIVHTWVD